MQLFFKIKLQQVFKYKAEIICIRQSGGEQIQRSCIVVGENSGDKNEQRAVSIKSQRYR